MESCRSNTDSSLWVCTRETRQSSNELWPRKMRWSPGACGRAYGGSYGGWMVQTDAGLWPDSSSNLVLQRKHTERERNCSEGGFELLEMLQMSMRFSPMWSWAHGFHLALFTLYQTPHTRVSKPQTTWYNLLNNNPVMSDLNSTCKIKKCTLRTRCTEDGGGQGQVCLLGGGATQGQRQMNKSETPTHTAPLAAHRWLNPR